jgi:predicted O-methyltransferase YrrM
LKQVIKRILAYRADPRNAPARETLDRTLVDSSLPKCPPWQGDVIVQSIDETKATQCLELGFHTGSTALYMLHGMSAREGRVLSIEPNVDGIAGFDLIKVAGYASRHEVIQAPSQLALPELIVQRRSFDFAFLDGWKTFDALAVDVYFVARLMRRGGIVMLDDYGLPSVRRAVRLLETHYGFTRLSSLRSGTGPRHRLYVAAVSRSPWLPFVRLQKTTDVEALPVSTDWHFYRRF